MNDENVSNKQKEESLGKKKKLIIPIVISVVLVVVVISVVLGIFLFGKGRGAGSKTSGKGKTVTEDDKDVTKHSEDKSDKQASDYPKDIVLTKEQGLGLIELTELLAGIGQGRDESLDGYGREKKFDELFLQQFITYSIDRKYIEANLTKDWEVREDVVTGYLKNTFAIPEVKMEDVADISQGTAHFPYATPKGFFNCNSVRLDKVTKISKGKIDVKGILHYDTDWAEDGVPYSLYFEMIMGENPNSRWGGFTLEEIKHWGVYDYSVKDADKSSIDNMDISELTKFVGLLGGVEWQMLNGKSIIDTYDNDKEAFGDAFFGLTMIRHSEKLEDNYDAVISDTVVDISKKDLASYLTNSINSDKYGGAYMESEDSDSVRWYLFDAVSRPVRNVEIGGITVKSENEIQIKARMTYIRYYENSEELYPVECQITMEKNPKSVWGGYTLKSIDSWTMGKRIPLKDSFTVVPSSVFKEAGYYYGVENLVDGDASTCWAEGVNGSGVGEKVEYSSQQPVEIDGFALLPGLMKSEELFNKNGVPDELLLTLGTKMMKIRNIEAGVRSLKNDVFANPMQIIRYYDFGETIEAQDVKVEILSVRSGNKYEDTCISEMYPYAYRWAQ